MFDGTYQPSSSSPPLPPRPAPLDIQAVLPALRTKSAETLVTFLARVTADGAMAMAQWLALNWGPDADYRDHNHPVHAAALEPASPPARLTKARSALMTACWRYRLATGRDGLALAHRAVEQAYGIRVAAYALQPLVDVENRRRAIDDVLMQDDDNEPPHPEPGPSTAERQAAAAAMAEWMLSDPSLHSLQTALHRLTTGLARDVPRPEQESLTAVQDALARALGDGLDREGLQAILDVWAEATGGPPITITVVPDPPTLP